MPSTISSTYLKEHPKRSVALNFFLQPLLRLGPLPNIRGVDQSELSCRIEKNIPDPQNDLVLFSLSKVHRFE